MSTPKSLLVIVLSKPGTSPDAGRTPSQWTWRRFRLGNGLQRLRFLQDTHSYLIEAVQRIDRDLRKLFDQNYPQVLTHGDLSLTNILVDEDDLSITGIVDWSLASVLPLGMELDTLRLTPGSMDLDGWADFECRGRLEAAFWEELFSSIQEDDVVKQRKIRNLAETACKLGAILRYAFKRDEAGRPTFEVLPQAAPYLPTWFAKESWSVLVLKT